MKHSELGLCTMYHSLDNITLRPLKFSDKAYTHRWRNDPYTVCMVMGYRFPVTEEMEEDWFNDCLKDSQRRIVYVIQHEDKPIGMIRLDDIDWVSRRAMLGIVIGEEAERGKGHGTKALELILKTAREVYNLRKITLNVIAHKNSAVNLYKRTGFIEEGRLKEHFYMHGLFYDVIIMSLFL